MTRWPEATALAAGGGSGAELFTRILIPCAVLIVLVAAAWLIAAWARKRAADSAADEILNMPFTLDSLRRMHADGQLTDDEFQRAKARMLQRASGKAAAPGASAGLQVSAISADETDDDVELGPNLLDSSADNDDSADKT